MRRLLAPAASGHYYASFPQVGISTSGVSLITVPVHYFLCGHIFFLSDSVHDLAGANDDSRMRPRKSDEY
jgi:hypothetical protein